MNFKDLSFLYTQEQWIGVIGGLLAISVLVYVWMVHRRTTELARYIQRRIERLGQKVIKDAMLPNGLDGFVFIDYLVLMPGGILVFYLRDMPGYIFGAMKMDEWTQMVESKTIRFKNPLYELGEAMRVLRSHMPDDVPLEGRVVFAYNTEFPKGIPENVCLLENLQENIGLIEPKHDQARLHTAWEKLVNLVNLTRSENQFEQRITRFGRV